MDDVESINVLKGPAATALYGSRGGAGAIIITTKAGQSEKGLLEVSHTLQAETYYNHFNDDWRRETMAGRILCRLHTSDRSAVAAGRHAVSQGSMGIAAESAIRRNGFIRRTRTSIGVETCGRA